MWKLSGLCLLLAALSRAVAGDKVTTAYFTDGGDLTLDVKPSYSERITNILWKFKSNLVAEWVDKQVPLELYGTFDGRAELNTVNARLVIHNMSKADAGKYAVGINSKVHGESYDAQWLKNLQHSKLVVVIRPLTCALESKTCNASCEADTKEAGLVTYSWKFGEKEWKVSEKDVEINQTDHALDKTITCRISNTVSEQVGEAINPLYSDNTGPIVAGVLTLLSVGGVAVGVFFMRKREKFCFKDQNSTKPDPTPKQPDPNPNKPDPTPTLNQPDPTPKQPDPTLNKPDPTPNKPDPTTPVPEGDPSDPAAAELVPLCKLQDGKETV